MQIQMQPEPKPDLTSLSKKKSRYEKVKQTLSNELAMIFEKLADKTCLEQEVQGQETSITGALRARINDSLQSFAESVNRKKFEGVSLQATTFRQKEEGQSGADFVITFEVFDKGARGPIVSKSTLVQAKTAVVKEGPPQFLHCINDDLAGQLETIEIVSPGKGYLMLYTDGGAYAVPAGLALKSISGTVFSHDVASAHKSGHIMQTMAICTGGDMVISPQALQAPRKNGRIDASKFARILAQRANTEVGNTKPPSVIAISANIL